MTAKRPRKVLEKDVLKAVWQLLHTKYKDGTWVRVNPVRLTTRKDGKLIVTKTPGSVGCSDIVGCYRGDFIGIECKAPGGKLSDSQLKWQDHLVKNSGGTYAVVDSVDGVEELMRMYNV